MPTLVDRVELNVVSRANLEGLNRTEQKLRALDRALDQLNARMNGLQTAFKIAPTGIEQAIRSLMTTVDTAGGRVKTKAPQSGVAQMLGVTPEQLRASLAAAENELTAGISKMKEKVERMRG